MADIPMDARFKAAAKHLRNLREAYGPDHPRVNAALDAVVRLRMEAEAANPQTGLWYLSFADAKGFRGGVLVDAVGFADAMRKSHTLKINPGGEVEGHGPVTGERAKAMEPWKNQLLSKAELQKMDRELEAME